MNYRLLDCLSGEYGLEGQLQELYSYQDQAWLLTTAGAQAYVVKVMHAGCDELTVDLQCSALEHLANLPDHPVPVLVKTHTLQKYCRYLDAEQTPHLVWVVGYIPGIVAAEFRPANQQVHESLGQAIASLHIALLGFDHPQLSRQFKWKMTTAGWIRGHLSELTEFHHARARWLERTVRGFCDSVLPALLALPTQAVHGDLNDHNVVFDATGNVAGLIDFGDACQAPPVTDLAIAAAYFMMEQRHPLQMLAALIRGYHSVRPLAADELALLYPLIKMRLAVSLTCSLLSRGHDDDDDYRLISEKPALALITQLAEYPDEFIREWVFASAGRSELTHKWQRCRQALQAAGPATLIDADWSAAPVLDLGASSGTPADPFSGIMTDPLAPPDRVTAALGRYGEPRLVYQAPLFKSGSHPSDDARTVHAGVDLFVAAGTPVHAPLDGIVHALDNRDQQQDYGPVMVVRHVIGADELYTLYGHLRSDCLGKWRIGDRVQQGDVLCHVGAPPENGGWPPHLHFQCVLEDLGWGTDIPGVCYDRCWPVWQRFFPNPGVFLNIADDRLAYPEDDIAMLKQRRRQTLGHNLSLAYDQPLKIVRGWQQYLFDHRGRCYLDAYNNVPHVGHCHPRVVDAVCRQMRILNTNTRYLHDTIVEYAEQLGARFAAPLGVCFFVNSASEANELALRLARAHTGARDMIVMQGAYHGHTTTLIDISPYKAQGKGGQGCPDWVHQVPLVDLYRGQYRYGNPQAGTAYAHHVQDAIGYIHGLDRNLCGYICESLPSVGGQLVYPPGYLQQVYQFVRAAGGVCIADEVQTGFGRIGDHFWGFEQQQVQPDIVVLGKPIGNGHPLGAVVTTPAIAQSFANGMEFFSTFGGNTVSCAAGLEVLRIVDEEGVQAHVKHTGDYLRQRLDNVTRDHPLIGDVRGMGLFLGIEVVTDRETREPAAGAARYIKNRLRDLGILIGTDGIHDNVLKIRPPTPFNLDDAERLSQTLADILNDNRLKS